MSQGLLLPRPEVAAKPAPPARKPVGSLPGGQPPCLRTPGRWPPQKEPARREPSVKASSVEDAGGTAPEPPRPRPKGKARVEPSSPRVHSEDSRSQAPAGMARSRGKLPPALRAWVRRPRASVRGPQPEFESREALARKVAEEATARPAAQRGPDRPDPEPRVDRECLVKAEAPPQDPDSNFLRVAQKIRSRKKERLLCQQGDGQPQNRGGPARVTLIGARVSGEKPRWMGSQRQQPREPVRSAQAWKGQDMAEVRSRGAEGETQVWGEQAPRGGMKNRIGLFGEEGASATAAGS